MGLFTDQTEHAPDDADLETPEKFSKPDNRSKRPGDSSVDPVGEESKLIEEEKAQKGVVSLLQPCHDITEIHHIYSLTSPTVQIQGKSLIYTSKLLTLKQDTKKNYAPNLPSRHL